MRAKPQRTEFVAKLGIVVEEADETQFWLELLQELGLLKAKDQIIYSGK